MELARAIRTGTGPVAPPARAQGADPAAGLVENDSNPIFARLGHLVVTGPTNTNLRDLYHFWWVLRNLARWRRRRYGSR